MTGLSRKQVAGPGIPIVLSLPLGLLAALFLYIAVHLPAGYANFLADQSQKLQDIFLREGVDGLITSAVVVSFTACAYFLAAFIVGMATCRKWTLQLLRRSYTVVYVLVGFYTYAVFRVTGIVFSENLKLDGLPQDNVTIFYWRSELLWPVYLLGLVAALVHVLSWRKQSIQIFEGFTEDIPAPGDVILENLRTHGRDPMFRKSVLLSATMHVLVVVIPILLARLTGCIDPYIIPGGDEQFYKIVQVVKPKKKPKKKRVSNPKSAISFYQPDLDDSDLEEEVEKETQLQHEADPTQVHKKAIAKEGSMWPKSVKGATFRFIRLQFSGPDWNDGMDQVSRADINFLREFHKATKFRVAKEGESHPISALSKYPPGQAPPFVYMTGSGRIRVSGHEIETLRNYLQEGGMLFADCGSKEFDRNFRAFIRAVFPGEDLKQISDDDPIYSRPFVFQDGAPPLWHHGGYHAMGIRRGNRWVVYYHPGDMNDAWKTGHSGIKSSTAKHAYELGVNIVYHAFIHYLDATRKYRK